ncbi:MAG TPA: monovalent cation/H+ antiporter complex subunit F [Streptomyces sp.]|nr:monovalent cation/H+ antiporter complex subunit F [Streptomyces sp.]
METVVNVVIGLLLVSGALVTVRLVRGPSMLDRAVALDALVAVVMAGIGVLTAVRRIPYYLPALLVLSFLGFTGSVSIARFLALRDEAGSEDADQDAEEDTNQDEEGEQGGQTRPGGGEQGSTG